MLHDTITRIANSIIHKYRDRLTEKFIRDCKRKSLIIMVKLLTTTTSCYAKGIIFELKVEIVAGRNFRGFRGSCPNRESLYLRKRIYLGIHESVSAKLSTISCNTFSTITLAWLNVPEGFCARWNELAEKIPIMCSADFVG